ncbi:hypothetical protein HDU67_006838 [Dinochytrium kinnereticum]|nr:hypothetical protein HDU67_006838 [Dinochytrium kinnereticum]
MLGLLDCLDSATVAMNNHTLSPSSVAASSGMDKKKRGKRYNLKLSNEHRHRFQEPYHEYLNSLLDLLPLKDGPSSPTLSSRLFSSLRKAPKGTDWTIWISLECRNRFLEMKAIYAPGATHSEFVEFLLISKDSAPESAFSSSSPNSSIKSDTLNPSSTSLPMDATAKAFLSVRSLDGSIDNTAALGDLPSSKGAKQNLTSWSIGGAIDSGTSSSQANEFPKGDFQNAPRSRREASPEEARKTAVGFKPYDLKRPVKSVVVETTKGKKGGVDGIERPPPQYCYLHGVCHDHDEDE